MRMFTGRTPPITAGMAYLGQTVRDFSDAQQGTYVLHFWAQGKDLARREVVYSDYDIAGRIEKDRWFIKNVPRWLNGDNVWSPIKSPSDWLEEQAAKNGFEWDTATKWWAKKGTKAATAPAEESKPLAATPDMVDWIIQEKEHDNGGGEEGPTGNGKEDHKA